MSLRNAATTSLRYLRFISKCLSEICVLMRTILIMLQRGLSDKGHTSKDTYALLVTLSGPPMAYHLSL